MPEKLNPENHHKINAQKSIAEINISIHHVDAQF